jgi:hypothetical protein
MLSVQTYTEQLTKFRIEVGRAEPLTDLLNVVHGRTADGIVDLTIPKVG